jgi:ribosomal protein S18 acetylase RimI-like enzyme
MVIRTHRETDQAEVVALWKACGLNRPVNDPLKDIQRKLAMNREWFLVGELHDRIVGTMMVGYEGHRGWINYLAIEPSLQRIGLGRALVDEPERLLRGARCPKINLQVRSSNVAVIAFYQRLGFFVDDVISLGKRLESDSPVYERKKTS